MAEALPLRIRAAIALLDPKPDERILEIGCGTGVAVEAIAARLDGGVIVGLDRSATAVAAATARNAAAIASGRARFVASALARASLPRGGFDAAVAINVNVFWQEPGAELAALHGALAPGGRAVLLFEAPPGKGTDQIVSGAERALLSGDGWRFARAPVASDGTRAVVAWIARPR